VQRLRHGVVTIEPPMPRYWFWMQAAIVVFVVAGMVIAITKLA
jgi:hypothetical protein